MKAKRLQVELTIWGLAAVQSVATPTWLPVLIASTLLVCLDLLTKK